MLFTTLAILTPGAHYGAQQNPTLQANQLKVLSLKTIILNNELLKNMPPLLTSTFPCVLLILLPCVHGPLSLTYTALSIIQQKLKLRKTYSTKVLKTFKNLNLNLPIWSACQTLSSERMSHFESPNKVNQQVNQRRILASLKLSPEPTDHVLFGGALLQKLQENINLKS